MAEIALEEAIQRRASGIILIGGRQAVNAHFYRPSRHRAGLGEVRPKCSSPNGDKKAPSQRPIEFDFQPQEPPQHRAMSNITGLDTQVNRRLKDSTLTLGAELHHVERGPGPVELSFTSGIAHSMPIQTQDRLTCRSPSNISIGAAKAWAAAETFRNVLAGETVDPATGQVLQASPERVEPFCKYYLKCGGCQLQHWQQVPYQAWKRDLIATALEKRGIQFLVGGIIDAHGAGRRRVSLHVRRRGGVVQAGFMAARSHDLIDIEQCPILVPALRNATDIARKLGSKLGDCDVSTHGSRERS